MFLKWTINFLLLFGKSEELRFEYIKLDCLTLSKHSPSFWLASVFPIVNALFSLMIKNKKYIFIFREQEKERNTDCLPFSCPQTGQTHNPCMRPDQESNHYLSVQRMTPTPLSHSSQGLLLFFCGNNISPFPWAWN